MSPALPPCLHCSNSCIFLSPSLLPPLLSRQHELSRSENTVQTRALQFSREVTVPRSTRHGDAALAAAATLAPGGG